MENLLDDIELELIMKENEKKFYWKFIPLIIVVILVFSVCYYIFTSIRAFCFLTLPVIILIEINLIKQYPHLPNHFD